MSRQTAGLITAKTAVWLGAAGIAGSLVLLAGDMLFYYNGDETNFIVNMAGSSPERIIASGICALLAAWLYTLGAGQIYYAFQPAKKWVHLTTFLTFTAIMISYGVVHGAYIAIATSAKNGAATGLPPGALTQLAIDANNALRQLTYIPFGLFTLMFIAAVWTKTSHYPRWIILFSPIIPFLLMRPIVGALNGRWQTIIGGGYLNLILLLFYTASTVALWPKQLKS